MIDYHMHSYNSMDSSLAPEDIAVTAIKKGFREICLTEHKDLYPGFKFTEFYDDGIHTRTIDALRKIFGNKIKIKKGVEMDFHMETIHLFQEFIETYHFDFILASVHMLEGEFVEPEHFLQRDPEEIFHDYFQMVLELSKLNCYDVIGHLDYVKRHSGNYPLSPQRYEDVLREILTNVIRNKKGIELNTSGWRQGRGEPYPSSYILRMYREMGGEIITIGSDAHQPDHIGDNIDKGIQLLKEIGFEGIYVFSQRIPEKILFE